MIESPDYLSRDLDCHEADSAALSAKLAKLVKRVAAVERNRGRAYNTLMTIVGTLSVVGSLIAGNWTISVTTKDNVVGVNIGDAIPTVDEDRVVPVVDIDNHALSPKEWDRLFAVQKGFVESDNPFYIRLNACDKNVTPERQGWERTHVPSTSRPFEIVSHHSQDFTAYVFRDDDRRQTMSLRRHLPSEVSKRMMDRGWRLDFVAMPLSFSEEDVGKGGTVHIQFAESDNLRGGVAVHVTVHFSNVDGNDVIRVNDYAPNVMKGSRVRSIRLQAAPVGDDVSLWIDDKPTQTIEGVMRIGMPNVEESGIFVHTGRPNDPRPYCFCFWYLELSMLGF